MSSSAAPTRGRFRRVRLILASPRPGPDGLAEAFVEEVRALKESDPLRPLLVLTGSNVLKLYLQRLLAIRLSGHANITFLLLKDHARQLGAQPMVDKGRRQIPEFGRELLLSEAVAVRSKGTYFERIASKEGFIEALGATVRDLKDAGVEPATLRAAARARRSGAAARSAAAISAGKLEDLADLYEAYDDLLRDRRFYDDEDLMRSAVAAVSGTPGPAVLVYGFYDATWLQRRLIYESLAFRTGSVFFPCGAGDDSAFDYTRPMLEWFRSFITERADLTDRGGSGSSPEVTLLSAPGEAREAAEAVRWLVSRARERSVPFGEMALLYRSGGAYRTPLGDVMSAAGGVPHFMADGTPVASTLGARALRLLLAAREDGLSRRTVIDIFSLTMRDSQTALWDRLSREAGVVRGFEEWSLRLAKLEARKLHASRGEGAGAVAAAAEWKAVKELRSQVAALHEAVDGLPEEASWSDLAQRCTAILRRFAPADGALEALERRISRLGGLDDVTTPVRLPVFVEVVRRALDEWTIRRPEDGEFQRSGIFIGNVMDARLLAFHTVALVGLVEKEFPVLPRQDPILLDDEREAIGRVIGADRLPSKGRRLEEERLLFRLARSCAAESLLISYPRLDPATARPRNPSPFLLRIAAELEGDRFDYRALDALPRMRRVSLSSLAPEESTAALLPREFDLAVIRRALAGSGGGSEARRRIAAFLRGNPLLSRALDAEAARWGETRFTAHDGKILRPNVLDALRKIHPAEGAPVSASRIEEYAACPLAYFIRRVLGLEPLEEPEEADTIDPMQRGSLVHRILYETFTALGEAGLLPLRSDTLHDALALLDTACARCFGEAEQQGVAGYPLMWAIAKERIREDLAAALTAEAGEEDGWRPSRFEIRYGMPGGEEAEDPASTAVPVELEIQPGRRVGLKGRIDRIDLADDGAAARVTDYKTGKMGRYRADSLKGGTTVQLPLYMIAAEKLLAASHPGLRSEEARFLSVDRQGGFRSVRFTAEALGRRREDLGRVLTTFLNGVACGVFFAYPGPETCRTCEFKLACGEGREARFARKRKDETAADYLRMREEIA